MEEKNASDHEDPDYDPDILDEVEEEDIEVYSCELCPGKEFKGWANLCMHHNVFHAQANRRCDWCDKKFAGLNALTLHVRKFHKDKLAMHEPVESEGSKETFKNLTLFQQVEEIGLPKVGKMLLNKRYVACYDEEIRMSRWTAEIIVPHNLKSDAIKDVPSFQPDPRVKNKLYPKVINKKIRKQLGHISPRHNHIHDPEAFQESFLMTNCMPMSQNVNTGVWGSLEGFERKLATKWNRVTVINGPVIDKKKLWTLVPGGYSIPELWGFFKIILLERPGEPALYQSYLVPDQDNHDRFFTAKFRCSLADIEEKTGLKFLGKVDAQLTWDSDVSKNGATCPTCLKCYSNLDLMKEHQTVHIGKSQCSRCYKEFDSEEMMIAHYKQVHKKFQCEKCEFSAIAQNELEKHMRMHNKEKPYECEHCEQKFTQSGDWKRHILLMHTEDNSKKQKCQVCKAEFNRRDHWLDHLKVCQDPDKIYCEHCGTGFKVGKNTNSNLKAHHQSTCEVFAAKEGRQLSKFTCIHCGKEFTISTSLTQHLKICKELAKKEGREIEKLSCPYCDKKCSNNGNLNKHLKQCKKYQDREKDSGAEDRPGPSKKMKLSEA